jgi:hypothetical protein
MSRVIGVGVALILGIAAGSSWTFAFVSQDKAPGTGVCNTYDPTALQITDLGAPGWRLLSGTNYLAMLDNEQDAQAALALAKKYTAVCAIGLQNKRPNRMSYIVSYWK